MSLVFDTHHFNCENCNLPANNFIFYFMPMKIVPIAKKINLSFLLTSLKERPSIIAGHTLSKVVIRDIVCIGRRMDQFL